MLLSYLQSHWAGGRQQPLRHRLVSLARTSRILIYRAQHLEMSRSPTFQTQARGRPDDMYRHLSRRAYLATGLSLKERVDAAHHHFRFEDRAFDQRYREKVYLGDGLLLWHACVDRVTVRLVLTPALGLDAEGDLSLSLLVDGERLHCISFCWANGEFFSAGPGVVPFIARNQGRWRRDDHVLKAFSTAFPQNAANLFCLAAMEGIALAIGAPCLIGVRASKQVCHRRGEQQHCMQAYDAFWEAAGATATCPWGYIIPVPMQRPPLHEVPAKHRGRARRRRAHWSAIGQSSLQAMLAHLAL